VLTTILRLIYRRVGNITANRYGAGSGLIWLENVRCNGTESRIADCQHNGWGIHSCAHSEDVAVSCYSGTGTTVTVRALTSLFRWQEWNYGRRN